MTGEIRRIGIEIDATRAQTGANQFAAAQQRIIASTQQSSAELSRMATSGGRSFDQLNTKLESSARIADAVRGTFVRLFGTFTAVAAVRSTVRFLTEYESALVSVQKAADVTDAGLAGLRQEFIDLARSPGIGTRATELADLAATAGTLGVRGADNIEKFVTVTAKLGNSLRGVDASTVAEAAGRILNLTGEGAPKIEQFGNVLARLEDTVANSADAILRGAKDVATATAQFGVSSTDVLGLSGAFADIGIRSELARSVVTRSFLAIQGAIEDGGAKLSLLSQLTGIAGDKLSQEFGENAVDVFTRFTAGLKASTDQGVLASRVLEALGLDGTEINAVLPALATNYERVATQIANARTEAELQNKLNADTLLQATTLQDSFDRFGATLDAVKNKLAGSTGGLKSFVDTGSEAIAIVFGIGDSSENASESARRLADVMKATAVAGGALVGIKLSGFLLEAAAGATGLSAALGAVGLRTFGAQVAVVAGGLAAFEFGRLVAESKEFATGLVLVNRELAILKAAATPEAAGAGILNTLAAPSNLLSNLGLNPVFKNAQEATAPPIDVEAIRAQAQAALVEIANVYRSDRPNITADALAGRLAADVGAAAGASVDAFAKVFDSLTQAANQAEPPAAALADSTQKTSEFASASAARYAELQQRLAAIAGINRQGLDTILQQADAEEKKADSIRTQTDLQKVLNEGRREAIQLQQAELANLEKQLAQQQQLGQSVGRAVGTSTVDALKTGDLRGAAAGLGGKLQDIALEQTIVKPLEEAFGNLFSLGVDDQVSATKANIKALEDNTRALGGFGASALTGGNTLGGLTGSGTGSPLGTGSPTANVLGSSSPNVAGYGGTGGGGILDSLLGTIGLGPAANSQAAISGITDVGGGSPILSGLLTPGAPAGGSAVASAAGTGGGGYLASLGGLGGLLGGLGGGLGLLGGLQALSRDDATGSQKAGGGIQAAGGILSLLGLIPGLQFLLPLGTTASLGGGLLGSFAQGGAFSRGRVIPFASGGLVDSPTFFPLAGGNTGLAGEAGPEGILPLRRTRSGALGVQTTGGGRGSTTIFNITTPDANSFRRSQFQIEQDRQRERERMQ